MLTRFVNCERSCLPAWYHDKLDLHDLHPQASLLTCPLIEPCVSHWGADTTEAASRKLCRGHPVGTIAGIQTNTLRHTGVLSPRRSIRAQQGSRGHARFIPHTRTYQSRRRARRQSENDVRRVCIFASSASPYSTAVVIRVQVCSYSTYNCTVAAYTRSRCTPESTDKTPLMETNCQPGKPAAPVPCDLLTMQQWTATHLECLPPAEHRWPNAAIG